MKLTCNTGLLIAKLNVIEKEKAICCLFADSYENKQEKLASVTLGTFTPLIFALRETWLRAYNGCQI